MGLRIAIQDLAKSQKAKVQMMKYKVAYKKGRVTKLENEVRKLQFLIRDDILSLLESTTSYKGNAYPTYEAAVAEIDSKYKGTADWGVLQTGNIIDLRSAFIIGEGITVTAKGGEEAEKELEWTEKFLEYNDLDKEVAQEFAKEAEIEGKIALKLALEENKNLGDSPKKGEPEKMVSVRFVSWADKKYKVESNPKDYLDYQKLKWEETGQSKKETLTAEQFVYKKFGGRISKPNEAAPKIMKCLTQIEGLDKALRDWRQINHIFAGPILYAKCLNEKEVKVAAAALADRNFKINKIAIGTFELSFLTLDIKGIESSEKEIITAIKMISGTTGIPVHFLGFAELMSNRSTAENLMEMINAATTKERQTWMGAYKEVITKAMRMFNEGVNPKMSEKARLDPNKIKVDIPLITKEHYDRLEKIFAPLYIADKLSGETFFSMVPGFDVKAELERMEAKMQSEIEQIKNENKDLKAEKFENNLFKKKGEEEE